MLALPRFNAVFRKRTNKQNRACVNPHPEKKKKSNSQGMTHSKTALESSAQTTSLSSTHKIIAAAPIISKHFIKIMPVISIFLPYIFIYAF